MNDYLETDRLELQLVNMSHRDEIYALYSSDSVCKYYDIEPFKKIEESIKHIDRWLSQYEKGNQIRYVFSKSKKVIGTCGLYLINHTHKRACLGYDLMPDYWGNGYASEAVEAMIGSTQREYNLRRIQAEVMPENSTSVRLLERIGFQCEGLLKQYEKWGAKGHVDLLMYSRIF